MFNLATPLAFTLLPLPWLVWAFVPPVTIPASAALPVPFFNALPQIKQGTTIGYPRALLYFFITIWTMLIIALAGPQWVGDPILLSHQGRNIFLVLDVSGSMELPDMQLNQQPATRLQVVKAAAENFVRARQSDHIGLILFGSEAYLQTPLTFDHQAILSRIADASVGLAGKTTSIGDAIGLAIKKLQHTPKSSRVIILLTDGSNNSGLLPPNKAAELAKTEHIKIYTIGLSTDNTNQRLMNLFISMQTTADLDEKTLQHIAKITGGQYFRATNPASLNQIYQKIDQLETSKQTSRPIHPKRAYYPWLISACVLLMSAWMLYSTRRRHIQQQTVEHA